MVSWGTPIILAMVPNLIIERPLLARLVAAQFPYIFVDESQDTFKAVVGSLKHVERLSQGKVCLGFFGDPMQQIYQTGVGEIGRAGLGNTQEARELQIC